MTFDGQWSATDILRARERASEEHNIHQSLLVKIENGPTFRIDDRLQYQWECQLAVHGCIYTIEDIRTGRVISGTNEGVDNAERVA